MKEKREERKELARKEVAQHPEEGVVRAFPVYVHGLVGKEKSKELISDGFQVACQSAASIVSPAKRERERASSEGKLFFSGEE